jgi:hypothetical protein
MLSTFFFQLKDGVLNQSFYICAFIYGNSNVGEG